MSANFVRLHVTADAPWTIGRALGCMETRRVWLIVDESANEHFRRWIEGLEDACGSLGHMERLQWSPSLHRSEFRSKHRSIMLVLMAQRRGHAVIGRLPPEIYVNHIFPKLETLKYVKHVSYERVTPESVNVQDKAIWLDDFFDYWYDQVDKHGWDGREFAEMGVSVCGDPAEDSICCDDTDCPECSVFRSDAGQKGIYEP